MLFLYSVLTKPDCYFIFPHSAHNVCVSCSVVNQVNQILQREDYSLKEDYFCSLFELCNMEKQY